MMKRFVCLFTVLALLLCALPVLGEESGDENDALMLQAVETLKAAWKTTYRDGISQGMPLNGILDIRGARLIRFVENPPEPMSKYLELRYGDPNAVDCVIEFTGFVDFYGGGDAYYDEMGRSAGTNCIVVLRSGDMLPDYSFFSKYTARYYDQDFTPFIRELIDFGDRYAGVYWLLEDGKDDAPDPLAELEEMMRKMLEKVN